MEQLAARRAQKNCVRLTTYMDTKSKGDIAEQAITLNVLKQGWGVLRPIGDRLPYDLVVDINNILVKVQVKSAWYDERKGNYVVDNRRTKTNRRRMIRAKYGKSDFDFAIVYLQDKDICYIFPVETFVGYGSEIHMVETDKRQRRPQSAEYRNAWDLISQWAACRATST